MDEITIESNGVQERIDALVSKNLDHAGDVKKIIREVLKQARKEVSTKARTEFKNDPRKAYQAVRYSVYKRIFGGNVSILQSRKAGKSRAVTVSSGGGIRRTRNRSARTDAINGYWGSDRGFILRFLNAGTGNREAGTRQNHGTGRGSRATYGSRGSIGARNWFGSSAVSAMNKAAGDFCTLIERAIEEVWDNKR